MGEIERSNDDGEPASSAGLPMLQVLRGNELHNVIAVVVRYFGGIKLGVGGLIRAYGSSVTQSIEASQILNPKLMYTLDLEFPYEYINAVETLCTDVSEIVDRTYDANVIYTVKIENPEDLADLNDFTKGTAKVTEVLKDIEYVRDSL